eukprot:2536689-Pleurochrysis_carterae.AAC.1
MWGEEREVGRVEERPNGKRANGPGGPSAASARVVKKRLAMGVRRARRAADAVDRKRAFEQL